ncbi:hypothetical protein CTI12_AA406010 [Artemisia annua]|uniref:Uncharacterized protein n=1 Tax=Artemisia annua TaxID=35608 RepID=A0A2U1M953_ARTAN|nr:hypothetical protein CTI12_AA406010 [Artemisia annua]
MATVGCGDIHAVSLREMIFVMVYVSVDMILGAYLIGNMTALIVKGSKTERYRDRMTDLLKYMDRNRLGRDIRNQIKDYLRLEYDSSYTDSTVIQDIPSFIRSKVGALVDSEFFWFTSDKHQVSKLKSFVSFVGNFIASGEVVPVDIVTHASQLPPECLHLSADKKLVVSFGRGCWPLSECIFVYYAGDSIQVQKQSKAMNVFTPLRMDFPAYTWHMDLYKIL